LTMPVNPPVVDVLMVMEVIATEAVMEQVPSPLESNITELAAEGAALHLQVLAAQPEVLPQGPVLPEVFQFAAVEEIQYHCVHVVVANAPLAVKSATTRAKREIFRTRVPARAYE
jgi:hypothetical protein